MSKNNYDTVLFDLDGTLVNSMDLHYKCWCDVISQFGLSLDRNLFLKNEGMNIYKLMQEITGFIDNDKINILIKEKDDIFIKNYKFNLFKGVEDIIIKFKSNNIRLGLVTASSTRRINQTIPIDFLNCFSIIVTSDNNGPGKPDPWPYQYAFEQLKSETKKTIVVENAPLGIKSAKNAGLTCVAIGSTLEKSLLNEADYYYDNFLNFSNDYNFFFNK